MKIKPESTTIIFFRWKVLKKNGNKKIRITGTNIIPCSLKLTERSIKIRAYFMFPLIAIYTEANANVENIESTWPQIIVLYQSAIFMKLTSIILY